MCFLALDQDDHTSSLYGMHQDPHNRVRDHTLVAPFWEGHHESRRCSRDTYPDSYITKYTSIRRKCASLSGCSQPVCMVQERNRVYEHRPPEPLETKKVRTSNVKRLDLYQSHGAVGHAVSETRHCVTKRLKGKYRVGLL